MKHREETILGKPLQNNSLSWVSRILESGGGDRKILEETVSKRMEKKNMIISIATDKACDTIQHAFMRNTLGQPGKEQTSSTW